MLLMLIAQNKLKIKDRFSYKSPLYIIFLKLTVKNNILIENEIVHNPHHKKKHKKKAKYMVKKISKRF